MYTFIRRCKKKNFKKDNSFFVFLHLYKKTLTKNNKNKCTDLAFVQSLVVREFSILRHLMIFDRRYIYVLIRLLIIRLHVKTGYEKGRQEATGTGRCVRQGATRAG
jgi:hypothetical protein